MADDISRLAPLAFDNAPVPWSRVTRWDPQLKEQIARRVVELGVEVPIARARAHIMAESQGNENAYREPPTHGLFQMTPNAWTADQIDFSKIMEPTYNIYCGVRELATRYNVAPRY